MKTGYIKVFMDATIVQFPEKDTDDVIGNMRVTGFFVLPPDIAELVMAELAYRSREARKAGVSVPPAPSH